MANERLEELPDGRVSYRMKRPAPDGSSHLVCSAVDFLRRLASITPPPRINLLRFHGVFAPNCRLRARIVPEHESEEVPPEPTPSPLRLRHPARCARAARAPQVLVGGVDEEDVQTDVLECERCGGRMRVTAFVADIGLAREVLGRLGLSNRPEPLATAAGKLDS